MQALQKQTLAALEDNTNTLKSVEHQKQRQSSFLDDRATLLSPSSISPVKLKDGRGNIYSRQ